MLSNRFSFRPYDLPLSYLIHSHGNNMKILPVILLLSGLLITLILPAYASDTLSVEYYTVQEYLELHPDEVKLMGTFDDLVTAPGTKIGIQQERPVRIAIVYPGIQASDYWRRSVLSFKKRMDEIGIAYEIHEFFSKPSLQARAQAEHIRKALASDPDYLVFTLDVGKHKTIIEKILTRDRPKLILQNITTPVRSWEGRQPFLYVGFDHQIGTKLLARYFLRKHGSTGPYSVLYFSRGYVSTMRGDTFIQSMKQGSYRTLRDAYYTDGDRLKAKAATLDILDKSPVDFIYACSTDIALGALDALREKGMIGKIPVNGWGGGSAELEAILQGDLDVTVMRNNDDNGVAMAEAIKLELEGNEGKIPTIYSGKFFLVEKGIGQARLNDLIVEAFRYSGEAELQ